jgi:hypothetical protein
MGFRDKLRVLVKSQYLTRTALRTKLRRAVKAKT